METMLTDGNVVWNMAELKRQDKTLWQKICDWFKKLVEDLNALVNTYKGYKPDSVEGQMVSEMQDVIQTFEALFAEALVDAGENYQAVGKVQKNTAQEGGVKYSISRTDSPSYEELINKKNMTIINVGDNSEGKTYSEMKEDVMNKAVREKWFDTPHPNADTDTVVFLTEKSFTHAFYNLKADFGTDTILTMGHIPQIIHEAILTSIDPPKNPAKAEKRVFTFFAAIEGENGIEPVKLTVKEYAENDMQRLPINIRKYFENHGLISPHQRLYDAKALEVIAIESEKEEFDASASGTNRKKRSVAKGAPNSTIRVSDLLDLVKGEARKYIPSGHEDKATKDIHFSDRDPAAEKTNRVLQRENAKLKQDVTQLRELLKLQRTVTNGTKFTKSSVDAAAGYLMKTVGAKGTRAELAAHLNSLYEYIAEGNELSWEGIKEHSAQAVEWLLDNSRTEKYTDDYAREVLHELRTSRVYLDEKQKAEAAYLYESYGEFRKQAIGSIIITDKDSVSLDSKWAELSQKYPSTFDPDISSNDMPMALLGRSIH